MPTTLNRKSFHELLREDLDWLSQQTESLEREHIAVLLRYEILKDETPIGPLTFDGIPLRLGQKVWAFDPDWETGEPQEFIVHMVSADPIHEGYEGGPNTIGVYRVADNEALEFGNLEVWSSRESAADCRDRNQTQQHGRRSP